MVRAERAGWLGATSELRDGGSLKNDLVAVQIVAGKSFVSDLWRTPLPNRLGGGALIGQAGDGIVSTRRGEVVFPHSEAGAARRPARSCRTNGQ